MIKQRESRCFLPRCRMLAGVLTICLLFLTACAPKPLTQPPDYTLVSTAEIRLQQGEIVGCNIFSVYYGEEKAEYYRYVLENGIAQLRMEEPQTGIRLKQLTYGQFVEVLEAVQAQLAQDGMGMKDGDPEIRYPISIKNTNILDKRYYLYSLKTKALMKDAGRTGQDEYGILRITNQWLGGEQAVTEYVYVVITDDTQTDTSKEVQYAGM